MYGSEITALCCYILSFPASRHYGIVSRLHMRDSLRTGNSNRLKNRFDECAPPTCMVVTVTRARHIVLQRTVYGFRLIDKVANSTGGACACTRRTSLKKTTIFPIETEGAKRPFVLRVCYKRDTTRRLKNLLL